MANDKSQPLKVSQNSSPLADLAALLEKVPLGKLADDAIRLIMQAEAQQQLARDIENTIEQLRLDVKYLQFDLEATRRERDEAKRYAQDLAWELDQYGFWDYENE